LIVFIQRCHGDTEGGPGRAADGSGDRKMRGGHKVDHHGVACAAEGSVGAVRRGDDLATTCVKRGTEGARAVAQCTVDWQNGLAVAAGEVDGAAVPGNGGVELIESRNGEAKGGAGRGGRRSADRKMSGGRGTNLDRVAYASEGSIGRVCRRESLAAGRHERDLKAPSAVVQGTVGRQRRLGVTAAKLDGAAIRSHGVVKLVLGGDRETQGRTRHRAGRSADHKMSSRRSADQDAVAGADDGRIGCVRSRNGLTAGRPERGAKAAGAVTQGAVGRQTGLTVAAGEVDRAGISGSRVIELVLSRDCERESRTRGGVAWSADHKMGRRGGAYQDAAACAGHGRTGGVRGRNGLATGGPERGAKRAGAIGQSDVGR